MKHSKVLFFISMLIVTTITACTDAQKAYYDLKYLTEDLAQNGSYYSKAEWYAAWQEYQEVSEQIDHNYNKYSYEEKKDIERYRSACVAHFTNAAANIGADLFQKGEKGAEKILELWDKISK